MVEIIVGTYEGFLLGYSLVSNEENIKLVQSFATHSHTSAVRSINRNGRYLASGGTDDKVVIIDMKLRKEHTVLMQHDGTIDAIAFTNDGTHLLTGGADGTIIVHRIGNWQVEKKWKKAHRGAPVTGIAIHPSDKMAMSIGGDKTLRTWNLVKGRQAFTINLNSKGLPFPTHVAWSPDGNCFSLISIQNVDVWSISKAGLEKRITCNSKTSCCAWINENKLAIGLENGNILLVTLSSMKAQTCHAYDDRVKSIVYNKDALYTVSSSGQIKVWSVDENTIIEKYSVSCGCRITCLAVYHHSLDIKKEESEDEVKKFTKTVEDSDDYFHKKSKRADDENIYENDQNAYVKMTFDSGDEYNSPASKKTKKK